MPVCDPAALIAAANPDFEAVISAAACAAPVAPDTARSIVAMADVPPSTGTGRLDVRGSDLWVAVDGVTVPRLSAVAAGPHLVQIGADGSPTASASGLVVIADGKADVWRVALLEDGARSYDCGDRGIWAQDLEGAGRGEAGDVGALAALDDSFDDCDAPSDRFAAASIGAEAGARVGDVDVASRSVGMARSLDSVAWDSHSAASARAGRLVSFGVPIGLAVAALGVAEDLRTDHDVPAGPIAVTGAAIALGSASAQQGYLVKRGVPTSLAAAGTGMMFLGTSVMFGEMSDDMSDQRPMGKMIVSGAVTAGLVQWVENEAATARARKRRRSG